MTRIDNKWVEVVIYSFSAQSCCTNFRNDVVPILPGDLCCLPNLKERYWYFAGRFLSYGHINGEIHIANLNAWMSCLGQDNTNSQCTIGYVLNIFDGNAGDHTGIFCPFFLSPWFLTISEGSYDDMSLMNILRPSYNPARRWRSTTYQYATIFPCAIQRIFRRPRRIFFPNLTPFAATTQCNS